MQLRHLHCEFMTMKQCPTILQNSPGSSVIRDSTKARWYSTYVFCDLLEMVKSLKAYKATFTLTFTQLQPV